MTQGLVRLRQVASLSAAIALFTSPIAAAQTPAPAQASDAPVKAPVLNSAAFARLVNVTPPDPGSAPDVRNRNAPPRLESLPHNPMATARWANAAVAPPVPRRSAGKKVVVGLVLAGVIAGALAITLYTGADFGEVLEGLFQLGGK